MTKAFKAILAPAALIGMAACSPSGESEEIAVEDTSNETLATLIGGASDLSTASSILSDAGLQSLFDGSTPYSLFAPNDAAFAAADLSLGNAEDRAIRVAVLREHIVPGYLTVEDIVTAIESGGGSVEMQTMGSNTLTFSGDADKLVVRSSDGAEATLASPAMTGANGTVFPIDGVLKSLDAPG